MDDVEEENKETKNQEYSYWQNQSSTSLHPRNIYVDQEYYQFVLYISAIYN